MGVGIREIKEADLQNKAHGNEFKWSYYVRRPVSHYIAVTFLRLEVTATTITLLWLFLGIAGCISIASGNYVYMIIGGVMLEFANILDRVDGIVARFKRPTIAGGILDTWSGVIILSLSMFSIGIGISKNVDSILINKIIPSFGLDYYWFIYVGFAAAFSNILGWAVRGTWRSAAVRFSRHTEVDKTMRSSKRSVFIVDNAFHYNGAYFPLLVLSIILNAADLFIMLVAYIYVAHLITIILLIMRNAETIDKQSSLNK